MVYSCASISFPLIAQYVLVRAKSRTHRRLFTRLDELTETLRSTAGQNSRLRQQHPEYFGGTKPAR